MTTQRRETAIFGVMEEKAYKNRKQQRRERQLIRIVGQVTAEVMAEQAVCPVLVCRRRAEGFVEFTYFIRRKRK